MSVKKLKLEKEKPVRGRPRKYPWDKWFKNLTEKGKVKVCKGKDYNCLSHGLASKFRFMAKLRNMRISVRIQDNDLTVTLPVS